MQDNDRYMMTCPVRRDLYMEVGAYAYARGLSVSEVIRRALARMIEADNSADEREVVLAAELGDMGLRPYKPRTASLLARAARAARAAQAEGSESP